MQGGIIVVHKKFIVHDSTLLIAEDRNKIWQIATTATTSLQTDSTEFLPIWNFATHARRVQYAEGNKF